MRTPKKLISLALSALMATSSFACLGSLNAFAAESDQPVGAAMLMGDVNRDGQVDVEDATIIQLYAVEDAKVLAKFASGEYSLQAADVDGSGKVDVNDATMVQLIAADLKPTTPFEETTAEPTAEPTTEEPTTAEPTTEEPTTAEPTPAEDVYVITGGSDWLDGWSPAVDGYVMTKQDDGTYAITVEDVPAGTANYSLKVVKFVGGDEAQKEWIGVNGTDYNCDFMQTADGDVTVTFVPETKEIKVTGDGVADPEYPINKITAVGSGQGGFLYDISWDPDAADNKMDMVSEGVYEIVYDEVAANVEYQVKFAANGGWGMNWGYVPESEITFGTPVAAQYNANDNIVFTPESENEYVEITLTLDLTNWNKVTKEGATYTITVKEIGEPATEEPTTAEPTEEGTTAEPATEEPTTAEPATEEPTTAEPATEEPTTVEPATAEPATAEPTTAEPTEEPTTAEPTTAEPTTAEPATEEPTTVEPATEPASEPVTEKTWTVAGDKIFDPAWNPATTDYDMVKQEDGTFVLEMKGVPETADVSFKVCADHDWTESYGNNGDNFKIKITKETDLKIIFDPETKKISVVGDGVEELVFNLKTIYVVGNDANVFGEGWNPAVPANEMEEKENGVYTFESDDLEQVANVVFKFAVNGSWTYNFGTATATEIPTDGTPVDLVLNGENMSFTAPGDYYYIEIVFDATEMDENGNGAKAKVIVHDLEGQ